MFEKNVAPTAVCKAIGLSGAAFSCWDNNTVPRQTTLRKIADYFDVSVEYLLEKEENPPASPIEGNEKELFEHIKSMLNHIADYFGVSIDFLLGKEEAAPASPIDNNKKELFVCIDQMTDEQLEQLKVFIKYLDESKNK